MLNKETVTTVLGVQ